MAYRYILTLAILVAFALFSSFTGSTEKKDDKNTSQITWYTMEEVQELMKKEKRKIYIDVYTDWCGWCKVMDKNTFTDPDVANLLNTKFYAVKLDGEGKEDITFKDYTFKYVQNGRSGYHELAAALMNGKMSYPTSVFLDENFNMIQPFPGYLTPEKLEPILEFLGDDIYKTQSWEDYLANR